MTQYHLTALGIPIPGVQILVDPYLPGPQQIKHAARGPYFNRREKRLARDPKNYTAPSIIKRNGTYFCHPVAFEALKLAVNSAT
jgi:hypothetical protein